MDWDLLSSRYPDLAFLLHMEAQGSCSNASCIDEERLWLKKLKLEGVDILYIYGIGLGYSYEVLKDWLHEKEERLLVFLEDQIQSLKTVFSTDLGKEILQDPKVHLCYAANASQWDSVLESCAAQFLSDRIEVAFLPSYQKRFRNRCDRIRMGLLRKTSVMHALLSESLHYHILMKNLAHNFLHLPSSYLANRWNGKFAGIPAIICGAGPSLSSAIPLLKSLEQKALLFAGGSTITALSRQGIRPHIAMAFDPNREEKERLAANAAFEVPFIYSARLHRDVLSAFHGDLGYMSSGTGGSFEAWMHEKLDIDVETIGKELSMEAMSVTTLATALAHKMGCNPIVFCGVDLAYTGLKKYAPGVIASASVNILGESKEKKAMEQLIIKKNCKGKPLYTLVKWIMESAALGDYAKMYGNTQFFNATEEGLDIPYVEKAPLSEIVKRYCNTPHDLRGRLRVEVENARLSSPSCESIRLQYDALCRSLNRCIEIMETACEELSLDTESPKVTVLEMDLQEEEAYHVLLDHALHAYGQLALRRGGEGLCWKKQAWEECLKIAKECSSILKSGTVSACCAES